MKKYNSEVAVIGVINTILNNLGSKSKATFYSDSQEQNSFERKSIFKVEISLDGSETILNSLYDIGVTTDRGISYVGSKVSAETGGEVRYLLFQAFINPKIGDYCEM